MKSQMQLRALRSQQRRLHLRIAMAWQAERGGSKPVLNCHWRDPLEY